MTKKRPSSPAPKKPVPGWLWPTAIAFAVAAALAVLARGLAGDEEAAHYLIARYAPQSPDLFLSLVGRPLVTLALTLPAQGGFLAARLASALATALAAFAVARVAQRTGWVHPVWAVALLLIQPFFLAHAATAMTEPWTAALVAVAIFAYVERRMAWLTIAAALLPLARFEAMVFWPLVVWALIREGRLRHVWMLALPLPLWNLGGWLASGDPLWLLHQTSLQTYPQRSPLHYFESLAWIVGAGLPAPMVVGSVLAVRAYFGRPLGAHKNKTREDSRRRALVVSGSILIGCLLVYTALAWWRPVTYGNLRYFAFAAPAIALLGAAGIRVLRERNTRWAWVALGASALAAFTLWSHPLLGDFTVLARFDVFFGVVTLPWLILYVLPLRMRVVAPWLAVALGVAGLIHHNQGTLHLVPTPEHEAVARIADLLPEGTMGRVPVHSAHPLLAFYSGANAYDASVFPRINERTSTEAPEGTLMFWESHYVVTRGPTLTLNSFLGTPRWAYLGGVVARDSTWVGAFFKRLGNDEGSGDNTTLPLYPGALGVDAWLPLARLAQSGVPRARVAARADAQDPDRWLDLATLLSAVGMGQEAADAHQRAVRLDPDNPRNYSVRADAMRRAGRLEDAMRDIQHALERRPNDGDMHLIAARIYMRAERPEDAGPHLRRASELLPQRWEVQYMTGRFLYNLYDWGEAEQHLLQATQLNPRHVESAVFASRAQMAQNKPGRAETTLRDLVQHRPKSPDGYLELGDLLFRLGRVPEAQQIWRRGHDATGQTNQDLARRVANGSPPP